MSKLIVATKCEDCVHLNVCKFESEFSEISTDKATKAINDDLGDLPVHINVACDNYRKNVPEPKVWR